ncbi:hypothetical protein DPMN_148468 [Dreissena polymorpha]|uniref:Uncharacterized protein n=1 Tax=Dreissena polymorpha TaxID=45954 RepID=A0A9D4J408_DREPO|nr:hypothetical protein DPMN_148468 [Dreissena polymorpha]
MGLMPYTARLAPDKAGHLRSLVRSYHVRKHDHEALRDLTVDSKAPHQTIRLPNWSGAGLAS